MLDIKDFSFFENQNGFDFKGFLIKTGSYWKWFLFGLTVSMFIAHEVNLRKQKIYSLETTIAIKEQDNPLFTNNTSLVFNWGGSSDQVQTVATTLKSRSHNEIVIDKLNFFVDYLQEQKYFTQDVYGSAPFIVDVDKTKNQLLGIPINIVFVSPSQFDLKISFKSNSVPVVNYVTNQKDAQFVVNGEFVKRYNVGQKITLPFLNCTINIKGNPGNYVKSNYIFKFNSFDDTVASYQNVKINIDEKSGSIIKLSMSGTNKARIVDYLNELVKMLMKKQLESKNLFAENTIKYIDTTLNLMETNLKVANNDLRDFSKGKNVVEIEKRGETYQSQILDLDVAKDEVDRKINYYNSLSNYLRTSQDYTKLPAPSVAGIEEKNIITNVSNLIELSVRRSEMAYSVKSELMFNNIDNEIAAVKKVLLENINAAKAAIQFESSQVNSKINLAESKIKQLPEDSQAYLNIMRKYNLSNSVIDAYLQKRNEAQIVKAANLSDIQFIDPAKDVGGGLIGPKTEVNYVIALFSGLLIPLLIVFLIFFINNSIQNTDDINTLTNIPLIGVVGLKHTDTNLSVLEKPKSALSESFRAIRSSLQFLYKKQNLSGTKTLMLTSSVSGEGKTFCSINIATVFAMSDKKTVIVGLDLRKPKIFDDFNLKNEVGAVNYLIGQLSLEEVTQKTTIPNLDVISSGPIPPNPSELIMGDSMTDLMNELKGKYDYIILDTPPVGLVTDAVELSTFADVTLYVMRQNFTKKEMVNLLNNRVRREELVNVSIILNGFENKAKYGAGYGYGYGYGYGAYSNGYHEEDESKNIFVKALKKITNMMSSKKLS
ncbi:polysaccharide biosynthesis tyrosine autokinase [Flavobacterium sp. SUN052]|uniref:exopolysaccharide transport family protein n=1 Tax=Flavobacterium sp. SUN052 TaxID=3002441 RepID=UPI00237EBB20|nr:polysaccharide biosynthesis tyrosine autokinase [Flavobacterium sp. SUN052]MEC4004443.1 polysaccharide biosynthesis tyrosine autokinase [Flavobacterium sp. SUN052]